MYIHMHSYQRALELLEAAAQVYESTQGPWSGGLANCLNNEGIVLRETGRHEQAIGKFHRATEIFTMRDGAEGANVAMTLNNLAMARLDAGEFMEARVAAEKTFVSCRTIRTTIARQSSRASSNTRVSQPSAGEWGRSDSVFEQETGTRDQSLRSLPPGSRCGSDRSGELAR